MCMCVNLVLCRFETDQISLLLSEKPCKADISGETWLKLDENMSNTDKKQKKMCRENHWKIFKKLLKWPSILAIKFIDVCCYSRLLLLQSCWALEWRSCEPSRFSRCELLYATEPMHFCCCGENIMHCSMAFVWLLANGWEIHVRLPKHAQLLAVLSLTFWFLLFGHNCVYILQMLVSDFSARASQDQLIKSNYRRSFTCVMVGKETGCLCRTLRLCEDDY